MQTQGVGLYAGVAGHLKDKGKEETLRGKKRSHVIQMERADFECHENKTKQEKKTLCL